MHETSIRPPGGSHRRRRHCLQTATLLLGLTAGPAPGAAQDLLSLTDPEWTRAVAEAVERHSPELAAARAALEAAQARAGAAGYAPPAVFSGEVDDVPDGYDVTGAGYKLEIGREFLTGGRGTAARALAATDVRRAEAELFAARRRIAARTFQHLSRAIASTRTAARLAAEDSLLLSAEPAVRDRFSVGEARYVDVLRLRTERLRVQTERAESVARARAARAALLGLAGSGGAPIVSALVDSALATPEPAPEQATLPPAPSLDSLLALSGEFRLAEAAVERARAETVVLRAEQRPRIAASIGAQRRVEDGASTFGPTLGVSVSLPFTARAANRAAAEAAEREAAAAEAALRATTAEVRAELASALAHYEAARERMAAFDPGLIRLAREERESALAAYRTGDMSLIELLDFERALARAEIERLEARADAAQAYANLISDADGGR